MNKGGFFSPFGPKFEFEKPVLANKINLTNKLIWKEVPISGIIVQVFNYTQGIERSNELSDLILKETLEKDVFMLLKSLSNIKYFLLLDKEILKDYLTEVKINPLRVKGEWDSKSMSLAIEYT